ncbi:MAG: carboxypeptidase regulatory-like domain-containing protein [Candidatus Riflebacteria bacterium]|nr:carboxypeptidase regulatory-like domain-containing protein [Candidatus Riflebacteria bacterium]
MTIRRWGGWLLAILGVTVTLALGCEKGALGVKKSTLTGRVVDADSPTTPVVGARVMVFSPEAVSDAALALGQNYATVTGADGRFLFEGLAPDKLFLEIEAAGYNRMIYPDTVATPTLSITSFWLPPDTTLDLGTLKMKPIANPLKVSTITVKGKILDGKSKDELADNTVLSMYFDGRKFQDRDITYAEFKAGLSLAAKLGDYDLTIITPNYSTYKNSNDPDNTINGRVDNVLNIVLTPISYSVRVTLQNKPFYMNDAARELDDNDFKLVQRQKCTLTITSANRVDPTKPKILATDVVDLDPYEPESVLSGISLPASLTVLLSGYREINLAIPYSPDTQGVIAMKLDLNGPIFETAKITRNTVFYLNPKAESDVNNQLHLRTTANTLIRCLGQEWGQAALNTIDANAAVPVFRPLPCGYILPFDIYTEVGTNPVALSPFNYQNFYYIDPVLVPSPTQNATFTAHLMISKTDPYLVKPD